MPKIYAPLKANHLRTPRSKSATPRTKMELGVRDDDPVQEMISSSNTMYAAGTHRSPQCKDSLRTPGPGAYRTVSMFPMKDEASGHSYQRRSPRIVFNSRRRDRVTDLGCPFKVVPPVVRFFNSQAEGKEPVQMSAPRVTVDAMPPCNSDHRILKGHSGTVPKGHGPPF
eukprot:TRINITY_DN15052_c0_g1_i1.p1 TRINITY_DN15052_c0_g1~~TRINITY_DN15052_c0_g1_i1.p1  ORF type:complete len:169 (+),score=17.39 TRINITY_DN15052_c0_g1_i1:102-608(+)